MLMSKQELIQKRLCISKHMVTSVQLAEEQPALTFCRYWDQGRRSDGSNSIRKDLLSTGFQPAAIACGECESKFRSYRKHSRISRTDQDNPDFGERCHSPKSQFQEAQRGTSFDSIEHAGMYALKGI